MSQQTPLLTFSFLNSPTQVGLHTDSIQLSWSRTDLLCLFSVVYVLLYASRQYLLLLYLARRRSLSSVSIWERFRCGCNTACDDNGALSFWEWSIKIDVTVDLLLACRYASLPCFQILSYKYHLAENRRFQCN